jgi:serine/threonine protein kinase
MEFQPMQRLRSFILEEFIASGSTGSVWRAHHILSGTRVAIKIVPKARLSTVTAQTRLQREIQLLKRIDQPFVVKLFQVFDDSENYFLVQEYSENGNLRDVVHRNCRLAEAHARRFFIQLLSALEYLHDEMRIVHRDIKCENILLDRHDNVRVIDFGLSREFADRQNLSTICGSPAYVAPEMVRGDTYTQRADIWSTGVVLYAMTTGTLPFNDPDIRGVLKKIISQELVIPSFVSPSLMSLLSKMLCKDPAGRITIDAIRQHPWCLESEYAGLLDKGPFQYAGRAVMMNGEPLIIPGIIAKVVALGFDGSELEASIMNDESTEANTLYKMLYREKVIDEMKELLDGISRPGCPGIVGSNTGRHQAALAPLAFNPRIYSGLLGRQRRSGFFIPRVLRATGVAERDQ